MIDNVPIDFESQYNTLFSSDLAIYFYDSGIINSNDFIEIEEIDNHSTDFYEYIKNVIN